MTEPFVKNFLHGQEVGFFQALPHPRRYICAYFSTTQGIVARYVKNGPGG